MGGGVEGAWLRQRAADGPYTFHLPADGTRPSPQPAAEHPISRRGGGGSSQEHRRSSNER